MKDLITNQQERRLYWWAIFFYFGLFSFNALATSIIAALVGAKWELLTGQEKFTIVVAVAANWTGMIIVFIQNAMKRLLEGKPPVPTGDTEHLRRGDT